MNDKYKIDLPNEGEVKRIDVADEYYVEIMQGYDHKTMIDFWLCHKHHGLKNHITSFSRNSLVEDPSLIQFICTREWIEFAYELINIEDNLESIVCNYN